MMLQAQRFQLDAPPVSCQRYGSGHINETYLVVTGSGRRYILQKINHAIFQDVPALMANIARVTRHLRKADPRPRHVLTLVPTLTGEDFLHEPGAGYFRVYDFLEDSLCLDRAESPADFAASAQAFGHFQRMLAGFDAAALSETIPRFHDTPNRFRLLRQAIQQDALGRLKTCRREADFALGLEAEAARMQDMGRRGQLPLRVTHNDTKLNNVLLDAATRQPLCVIDLDTVMPGLAGNDFGDSIRFGASTAAEDEPDLDKVTLSLPLYQAYTAAYLAACGQGLTPLERETLPLGAKLMTLECGVRFLTDYLQGDTYFRVHRPGHNLDRCRTQFKLVADMQAKWDDMRRAVQG